MPRRSAGGVLGSSPSAPSKRRRGRKQGTVQREPAPERRKSAPLHPLPSTPAPHLRLSPSQAAPCPKPKPLAHPGASHSWGAPHPSVLPTPAPGRGTRRDGHTAGGSRRDLFLPIESVLFSSFFPPSFSGVESFIFPPRCFFFVFSFFEIFVVVVVSILYFTHNTRIVHSVFSLSACFPPWKHTHAHTHTHTHAHTHQCSEPGAEGRAQVCPAGPRGPPDRPRRRPNRVYAHSCRLPPPRLPEHPLPEVTLAVILFVSLCKNKTKQN